MLDKREKFSVKFALVFELTSCAHNTRLPHFRYDKLLQNNEKLFKLYYG